MDFLSPNYPRRHMCYTVPEFNSDCETSETSSLDNDERSSTSSNSSSTLATAVSVRNYRQSKYLHSKRVTPEPQLGYFVPLPPKYFFSPPATRRSRTRQVISVKILL